MNPKNLTLCLVLAGVLLSGCSGRLKLGPGWEGEKVIAEGMAPYDGKDLAAAKAGALAAAQRRAVEQVVGVYVSGQTQVQQAMAINQKILSRTQGFIKRYKILKEGREGDSWKMKISAVVLVQDIGTALDDMKLVSPPVNSVRVLVMLRESVNSALAADDNATQGVYRSLGKKQTFALMNKPSGDLKPEDVADDRSVIEMGRRMGAAVVISGNADVYRLDGVSQLGSGFVPYRARVSLKAFSVSNGQLMAEASREASGIDPVENISIKKAMLAAGELAGQDITGPLENSVRAGVPVTVRVLALTGLDQLKKFQDVLRGIPGIQEIVLNRYVRGDAEISAYSQNITGEEIAASVLRMKPFPLDPQTVTQFEVVFKIPE